MVRKVLFGILQIAKSAVASIKTMSKKASSLKITHGKRYGTIF